MKRVLCVDNNPDELALLRRMLGRMKGDWIIECADNGPLAIQKMFQSPFDVVVSNFLMPNMNGAQLLEQVMKHFPQTVRIMLSGYFDWTATPKLMNAAHQYLCKPCDLAELQETISRALFLRDVLNNKQLQRVVSQIQCLPSMPSLYIELVDELNHPQPSTQQIAEIISRDLGMCAKMMQLVNSAYFGLPQRITDPKESVLYLGLETVKALVLSLQIFSSFDRSKVDEQFFDRLWNHCWSTGNLAKWISLQETSESHLVDQAFLAGLLHDVGKLVLVTGLPNQFRAALALQQEKRSADWQAEQEIFGCSHAEVGAYLLGLWGLPNSIVEAVALHHRPGDCSSQNFSTVAAVHIANAIEHKLKPALNGFHSVEIDSDYISKLGLTERLSFWRTKAPNTICEQAA
jgi:HD-like signal output (HDOD) protein/CheY-like chemotaxis protein